MAAASIERREKVGTDDVYLDIVPEISVTYAGKGFAGASFKNVFAMKLGDTDLTLNTSGTVAGADFPIVNSAHVYKPSFSTKKREQYDAYDKGEAIRFSVTLSGQTGVFSIGKDGKESLSKRSEDCFSHAGVVRFAQLRRFSFAGCTKILLRFCSIMVAGTAERYNQGVPRKTQKREIETGRKLRRLF